MKRNILTYSLLVLATAFAACSDKEYTVNTGEGSTTPSQPPAPLVRDVESFTVPGTEVSFDMVLVHGGTFTMGGYDAEGPEHQVTLSHDYYIGRTEVTQALYRAVMQANPSEFTYGDNYPVDQVSHWDAVHFCQKLSQLTGYRFTLPTEAQWEYAAQGGHRAPATRTDYAGGNNLGNVGWYWENAPHYSVNTTSRQTGRDTTLVIRHTSAVGGKSANALGLRDMTGNVREWCADWYSVLGTEAVVDPQGPVSSDRGRVFRGGSCNDSAQYCHVAHREGLSPMSKGFDFGFRVVINKN